MDNRTTSWRNDAVSKVTGRARYTDDLKALGMLHAVPVYTDHVHAVLKAVHTAEAAAMPGVVRVLTAKDVPGAVSWGQIHKDYRMLVDDRIRCWGDVVAVVVAETRAQAIAAAAKVTVDADPLPPLLDVEEAVKPGAPLVHEAHGSNITNKHQIRRGDADKALKECDLVLDQVFRTQSIEHAYLEPESALVLPTATGGVEVHGSMQHPFSTRRFVAAILGVPLNEVEVIGTPMGGGFGGKDDTAAIVCARAALAAKLTGRPVKMTYEREWSMRESYKRHPYVVHYEMGLTKDGIIKACRVRTLADGGAYCSVTPWVTWRSTVQCCGPYAVENVHCDTYGVYTNNVFSGAMRGFGSPQINFIVEQLVEMAAEKLGLDPIELRRRNMVKQGSTTITGQVLDDHTVSLDEALTKVMNAVNYRERSKLCSHGKGDGDELYGIGLAMSYRGMSLGAEGTDICSAIIVAQPDGSVLIETGIHENGQGAESTMMLVCAEELGLPVHKVRYRRPSTSTVPDSGTTVASRGTIMGTGSVVMATRKLKAMIAEALALQLSCEPEDIRFENGLVKGPFRSMPWDAAIKEVYSQHLHPSMIGTFRPPQVTCDEHTGQGRAYFTYVYGCQAAEVSVNRKTGKVKILSLTAAHEVGRAINPGMVKGQIYGGLAMGSGYGLMEEVKMDGGRITTLNLNTYKIPRAMDLPDHMTAIILENPDPLSLSGAKGCGEPTLEITAPALANAIYNATGQRAFSLPIRVQPLP
jgi:CO/xanthine dehydrogenase Mo-binding subunit